MKLVYCKSLLLYIFCWILTESVLYGQWQAEGQYFSIHTQSKLHTLEKIDQTAQSEFKSDIVLKNFFQPTQYFNILHQSIFPVYEPNTLVLYEKHSVLGVLQTPVWKIFSAKAGIKYRQENRHLNKTLPIPKGLLTENQTKVTALFGLKLGYKNHQAFFSAEYYKNENQHYQGRYRNLPSRFLDYSFNYEHNSLAKNLSFVLSLSKSSHTKLSHNSHTLKQLSSWFLWVKAPFAASIQGSFGHRSYFLPYYQRNTHTIQRHDRMEFLWQVKGGIQFFFQDYFVLGCTYQYTKQGSAIVPHEISHKHNVVLSFGVHLFDNRFEQYKKDLSQAKGLFDV